MVVYNPLGWERSGEVTVHVATGKSPVSATGAQVVEVKPDGKTDFADVKLHVLHVPALGYKVVWVGKGAAGRDEHPVTAKDAGDTITLENEALRVTVDKQTRMYHEPA